MSQQFFRLLRLGFILLDLLMINLVYIFLMYMLNERIDDAQMVQYLYFWSVFNIAWLSSSWMCKVYQQSSLSSFEMFSRSALRAYIYLLALTILYIFTFKVDLSRLFVLSLFISAVVALMINRIVYLFMMQYFRKGEHLLRKVIIIGYNDTSKRLAKQLEEDRISTLIVGYCEDESKITELSNYPIIGGVKDAIEVSKQYDVSEIFSTITPEQNETIYQLIEKADQALIRFRIIPNFNFYVQFPVNTDFLGDMPVFSRRKEPLDDVSNRIKKRLYDIAFSSIVIILVLSWLIPLISILILIESGLPIFFLQKRTGKDNRPFNCIKFRSMKVNKEADTKQATKEDERITKLGSFMRRTNLDEFPQFLNVFLGDMSIVGPRPHMLKHTDVYSEKINQYMVRQFMKPGITGWAQVNGFRGETRTIEEMEGRVEHDLWYMENWSLWLDTRIIFLTLYNMIRGERKAY
jgi:putative colanic acid biosysnthesis UDP-glucose lipid carrier transferase